MNADPNIGLVIGDGSNNVTLRQDNTKGGQIEVNTTTTLNQYELKIDDTSLNGAMGKLTLYGYFSGDESLPDTELSSGGGLKIAGKTTLDRDGCLKLNDGQTSLNCDDGNSYLTLNYDDIRLSNDEGLSFNVSYNSPLGSKSVMLNRHAELTLDNNTFLTPTQLTFPDGTSLSSSALSFAGTQTLSSSALYLGNTSLLSSGTLTLDSNTSLSSSGLSFPDNTSLSSSGLTFPDGTSLIPNQLKLIGTTSEVTLNDNGLQINKEGANLSLSIGTSDPGIPAPDGSSLSINRSLLFYDIDANNKIVSDVAQYSQTGLNLWSSGESFSPDKVAVGLTSTELKINSSDKETKLSNSTGLTIKDKSSELFHTQINDNSISLNNGNTQLVNGALNMSDGESQVSLSNTGGLSLNNGNTILSNGLLTLDTNTTLSSANGLKLKNATDPTNLETQLTDQKLTIENKNSDNSPGKTSISYNELLMEYAHNANDDESIVTRLYTDTSKSGLLLTTDPEIHKAIYIDADLNNLNFKMTDDNEDSLIEILTVGNEGQVKGNKLLSLEKINCPPSIDLNKGDIYADGTLYCDNFHVKSKIESDTLLSVVSSEDESKTAFQVNNTGTLTLKNVSSGQTQTIEINAATSKISGLDTLQMTKFNVNNAGTLTLENVDSTRTIEINAGTSTISGLDTLEFNGDNSEINNLQTISLHSLEFTGENSKIESLDSLEFTGENSKIESLDSLECTKIICGNDITCSGTLMANTLITQTTKSSEVHDSIKLLDEVGELDLDGSCIQFKTKVPLNNLMNINKNSITIPAAVTGTSSFTKIIDDSEQRLISNKKTSGSDAASGKIETNEFTCTNIEIVKEDNDGSATASQITYITNSLIQIYSAEIAGEIKLNSNDEFAIESRYFQFSSAGWYTAPSGIVTTYNNSTPCPQVLLINGETHIHLSSCTENRLYHALWKNGSGTACIKFYDGSSNLQKDISQPTNHNCDGGVIFVHDGDNQFSIGIIPGAKGTETDATAIETTGY